MAQVFYQWRPHPWHGISAGKEPPTLVNAYIEITPIDGIKYEIDKETGYLKVDRPQLTSSLPPALYGFIPKTYCGERIGKLAGAKNGGDGDPLDICVFSERTIGRPEVIVPTRVIGGFRMIDKGEADDKIIGVLESDPFWQDTHDLADLPKSTVQRLEHYFLTYKLVPGQKNVVEIAAKYDAKTAREVVVAAMKDYEALIKTPR